MNIKQIEKINSLKVFSKTIFWRNTNLRGTTLIGFELVKILQILPMYHFDNRKSAVLSVT